MISYDGIDFQVYEHVKNGYSHKNKKSALRYKVCLSIVTGDIVWINGLFVVGNFNDVLIFRDSLTTYLGPCERVDADGGYIRKVPRHAK